MEVIEIGARVTLVDRTGLGTSHELWQVMAIDGEMYEVASIRKDGGINKRRGIRKIRRQDIQDVHQDKLKGEPDVEPAFEKSGQDEAIKEELKNRKIPSWVLNAPDALKPYIHDHVELPELLTAAQRLIRSGGQDDQLEELKRYIKVNRRFVRKKVFEW